MPVDPMDKLRQDIAALVTPAESADEEFDHFDHEENRWSKDKPLKTKAFDHVLPFQPSKQDITNFPKSPCIEICETDPIPSDFANHVAEPRALESSKSWLKWLKWSNSENSTCETNDLEFDHQPKPWSKIDGKWSNFPNLIAEGENEHVFWLWLTEGTPHETTDARAWRLRYRTAINSWNTGRTLAEARRIAWGHMQRAWHRQHGNKPDPNICPGCGEPVADRDFIEIDDARLHADGEGDAALKCIIKYGADWRWAADEGLRALGLIGPPGTIGESQ